MALLNGLSKREREIAAIVFRLGEATARDVQDALGDGTSYSTVRAFLAVLETKGRLSHRLVGQRYLWVPAADPETEGAHIMAEAARTFFRGSRERAIAALIALDDRPLSREEIARLRDLIERSRGQDS